MEELNEQQKRVAERIMKVSSAGLGGPYSILLRSPVLAERYLGMTDYLRFETSLPHRLNELAILIEARLWDAQYEWWAHYPIAMRAGVSPEVAEAIRNGLRPTSMKEDEEVVYDVCIELSARPQSHRRDLRAGEEDPRRAADHRPDRGRRLLRDGVVGADRRPRRHSRRQPAAAAGAGEAVRGLGYMRFGRMTTTSEMSAIAAPKIINGSGATRFGIKRYLRRCLPSKRRGRP